MDGYRRPPLQIEEFRDAEGRVIPYGARWPGSPADESYSVTVHPERFAPLADVARALDAALPEANRPGGDGMPVEIRITDFPGAIIRVAGRDFAYPRCGCDACDEDVARVAEEMEQLVDAVVAGRYEATRDGLRYWGAWGSYGGGPD